MIETSDPSRTEAMTIECMYRLGKIGTCKRCGAWLSGRYRALMKRPRLCRADFPMAVPGEIGR
jgi:hypothetical protein